MIRPVGLGTAVTLLAMAAVLAVTTTAGPATVTPVPNVAFRSLDGSSIALSEFKGNVLLVNFWGTWCVPCLREIPELVRLSQQFDTRGFVVVGVAVDSGHPDDILAFMAEHGMDYPILMGDLGVVKRRFRVLGFPTSLLVDRQGMIRNRYFGPQSKDVFQRDVEPLL